MIARIVLVVGLVLACGCPGGGGGGTGTGSGSGGGTETRCEALRGKVETMYRAEAQVKEPKRVEEAVADNTAMVLADCAKNPPRVIACVDRAASLAELEATCLAPLDDEGSEGDALLKPRS